VQRAKGAYVRAYLDQALVDNSVVYNVAQDVVTVQRGAVCVLGYVWGHLLLLDPLVRVPPLWQDSGAPVPEPCASAEADADSAARPGTSFLRLDPPLGLVLRCATTPSFGSSLKKRMIVYFT